MGGRVEESAAYLEAAQAFALGQAVYDRRTALGLTPVAAASRAGVAPSQISAIEGGDSVPAIAVLNRLARALEAALIIELDGDTAVFRFVAHEGPGPDESAAEGRSSAA